MLTNPRYPVIRATKSGVDPPTSKSDSDVSSYGPQAKGALQTHKHDQSYHPLPLGLTQSHFQEGHVLQQSFVHMVNVDVLADGFHLCKVEEQVARNRPVDPLEQCLGHELDERGASSLTTSCHGGTVAWMLVAH